ncbi:MAG: oxaloacetate-decarboxylating malate dehydrogenase [Prochlorococcaceae cyanobacterium]
MAAAIATRLCGAALLHDPALNKGTAFSRQERRQLALEGLLPWQVETLAQQVERCWQGFSELQGDLERYAYLQAIRQSNLTLFHALLQEHIEALLPIVYTPTVGKAIQQFSRTYRSPSGGIYLAAPQADALETILRQVAPEPPALLLVTDSQGILGIGDQGIGGIHICQGKLAVYTLCTGLDPRRVLPVVLDVGTDRPELLAEPLYPGLRQPRLSAAAYDAFLERFITAVEKVMPGALVHWEDFGTANARRLLATYRHRLPSFNDDIQGTSGVAAAAVLAGLRGLGQRLEEQRIVIFGAGTAGCGIADRLARLLQHRGLSEQQARARLWLIDREGLLLGEAPGADARAYAKSACQTSAFGLECNGRIGLQAVVEAVAPSVLIGTSTVAGAFDRAVVEALCRGTARPIILPLSNPTALAEAHPADLLAWSGGRLLVATGSPFADVPVAGQIRSIGQCNNCFLFPGLGFGAVAVAAREVSEGMIDAALAALAEQIPAARDPDQPLMPPLAAVRQVSQAVARAVACAAVQEGIARHATSEAEALERLQASTWTAAYSPIKAQPAW